MNATNNGGRRALVVGLGISGIATALRLRQIGWTPVIVERATGRRSALGFKDFGQPWLMLRGDVEEAGFAALPSDVEIRYATMPTRIEQDADGVDVTLADTAGGASVTERFDLVVGADGWCSSVTRPGA